MSFAATPPPVVGPLTDPLVTTGVGQFLAEHYIDVLLFLGGLILLVAWLPLILRRLPLSLPIICVAVGWVAFTVTPFAAFSPHPIQSPIIVEKAAELIVIVSLMGAGLKIDRALTWANWSITARLLALAMPLTILAVMWGGMAAFGLPLATALLLGAALAPTDPVLASDVQIESPESRSDHEVRFALTSEGGLNDALAFPFVHLAIAASISGFTLATWGNWLADDVAIRLTMGGLVGVLAGKALGWVVYRLPRGTRLSRTGDGFVAVGATLTVYALAELLHGYGFLAVFVAGLMLRRAAEGHDYNTRMHDFADEAERLLMMVLLVLFGGMLAGGEMLIGMGWREILFALAILFIVRPAIGWVSLIGVKRPGLEKFIIAVFGIRGLGSVYYLAYGLNHGQFADAALLWNVLGLVVLGSIVLHGLTVTPLMRRLEAQRSDGEEKQAGAAG